MALNSSIVLLLLLLRCIPSRAVDLLLLILQQSSSSEEEDDFRGCFRIYCDFPFNSLHLLSAELSSPPRYCGLLLAVPVGWGPGGGVAFVFVRRGIVVK